MSDGSVAAWVHVGFEAIGIVGGMLGFVGGMAVLLARRTFVTRDELGRAMTDHATVHQVIDARLANGEKSFTELRGMIDMIGAAAQQAKEAGNAAREAANTVNVNVADLRGEIRALDATIKPIERLTLDMVEGHMSGDLNPRGKR
jgi:hypothetical protein